MSGLEDAKDGKSESLENPQAIHVTGSEFRYRGQKCYELPGINRPLQMLATLLLRDDVPVAKVIATTVQGEPGATRFFSLFQDVTDARMPAQPMARVQAEFVALREILLCKDRALQEKDGYHYPPRLKGVTGHNMDWSVLDSSKDEVRAVHYDFEDFNKFMKSMPIWLDPETLKSREAGIRNLLSERFAKYEKDFGNKDFYQPFLELLQRLYDKLSPEYVRASIDATVSLQEKPNPSEVSIAVRTRIKFYQDFVSGFKDRNKAGT